MASRWDRLRCRAHHGYPDAQGSEACCVLGEQVVTGADGDVREPLGDVLVPQNIQQGQVGAVGPGADPVVGLRPAERRVDQGQVARGHLHLVHDAEGEGPCVQAQRLTDLGKAGQRLAGEVLDID